jgi:hypothetical protein
MPRTDPSPSPLWAADAAALAEKVGTLLTQIRCAQAELGTALVEIDTIGPRVLFGYGRTDRWLEHKGNLGKTQAEHTLTRALALNPGRNLDGSPVPPLAPATAAAAAEGALSSMNIDAIIEALRLIPAEDRDEYEPILVDLARMAGPTQVRQAGQDVVARLDPDGTKPDDSEPSTPQREASLRKKRNGRWKLEAEFDDETAARAEALLDTHSQLRTGDDGPDTRGIAERKGDALSDIFDLALNCPDQPTQAGEHVHVMVTTSLENLKTGIGKATLGDTSEMSAQDARLHACDCMLIPAVLRGKSEPLDLGRLRRLISVGHRRALYIRDRGCAFPGCNRPPKHCQGHHIRHWADGGPTDLGNLVLLCAHHHRLMHRSGWEVRIAADGLPEFFPPAHIDASRKPRRNNLHPPLPFAA